MAKKLYGRSWRPPLLRRRRLVYSLAASGGTITSDVFKNNTGTPVASVTVIPWVKAIRCSDGVVVLELTNQALNGSSQLVITSPYIVAGVLYQLPTSDTSGVNFGMQPFTAT